MTADDVQDPDFQDSLKQVISDLTGVAPSAITLIFTRRDTTVSAELSVEDESAATSASSAVEQSASSGSMTTSLNTALAGTSYSGTMVSSVSASVSTASSSNAAPASTSSDAFYSEIWFFCVVGILGVALVVGIVAAVVVLRTRKPKGPLVASEPKGKLGSVGIGAAGADTSNPMAMKPDDGIAGIELQMQADDEIDLRTSYDRIAEPELHQKGDCPSEDIYLDLPQMHPGTEMMPIA